MSFLPDTDALAYYAQWRHLTRAIIVRCIQWCSQKTFGECFFLKLIDVVALFYCVSDH